MEQYIKWMGGDLIKWDGKHCQLKDRIGTDVSMKYCKSVAIKCYIWISHFSNSDVLK